MSNPCYFWCKSFHMILFLLKQTLRDQHWQIYILYPCLFESPVQFMLNIFPDCITSRLDNHTSLYTCIISQFSFFYNVCIPLCKILFHRSNGFHKFLFLCHCLSPHFIILNHIFQCVHSWVSFSVCPDTVLPFYCKHRISSRISYIFLAFSTVVC